MNYRHHFHAGNFADVMKHALLLLLLRGMQRKEKGFLYLDTHAGRGAYDLTTAARGDSLERTPEWPAGIGRVAELAAPSEALALLLKLVRSYKAGEAGTEDPTKLSYYPGSPWLAWRMLRTQDRAVLCEMHPEDAKALQAEFSELGGASVQERDGYAAIRALLPPPERRALVLIDPPFEERDEFARIVEALKIGLERMPAATFAVWYPLTERARLDAFFDDLQCLDLPPSWVAELEIAAPRFGLKMRGCGLLVLNPPWQLEREVEPLLHELASLLAQAPGASGQLHWVVREKP